jgi:TPR repeat protein
MPAPPRALILLTTLALLAATRAAAAAPPVCDAPDDQAKCEGGAGELPACTRLADALLHGRRVAVDRPRALELLTKACAIDADDYDAPTDPAACLALGQLRKDGWMFEIERTDNFRAPYTRAASRARCFDGDQRGCAVRARANLALAYANLAPGASLGPNAVKSAFGDAELGCAKGTIPRPAGS